MDLTKVKGVEYSVSGDKISEIILSFFDYKIETPKYKLFYHPYWFIETHIGLEKHFAILDATTSEVKMDVLELVNARKKVPLPFEELHLEVGDGFIPEYLRYAKVNEPSEAKEIVEYKLKYIYPDKQCMLATPHLLNVPVWEMCFLQEKIIVFGNDPNYKKTVLAELDKRFPKKGKTQSQLFVDTIEDFKSPKHFIIDFISVVKKTNKFVLMALLILFIIIIYFIIVNIVAKIKV